MKYFKILGMSIGYILGISFILTFLITIFSYFNILGDKATSTLLLSSSIISMIAGGVILGKNSNKRGYIEGLKLGLIITILFILFGYLGIKYNYKLNDIIYYLILITSSILGSILGVNIKKKN